MCGSPVSCGNSSSPLTELFPLPGEYSLSLKATTSFLKTNTRETDRAKSRQVVKVGTAWYLIQVNYRENKKIEKTVEAKISFARLHDKVVYSPTARKLQKERPYNAKLKCLHA